MPAPLISDAPFIRPTTLNETLADLIDRAPQPWRDLMRREPAVVAAQIATFRLDDAVMAYDLAADEGPEALVRHIGTLARRLNDWLSRLRTQLPGPFAETLEALDREMNLHGRVADMSEATPSSMATLFKKSVSANAATQERDAVAQAKFVRSWLSAAHRQLIHAIGSLQPTARQVFDERIKAGTIEPAVGLLLAELTASGVVDARLNLFTRRHTAFYYGDILGQKPADAATEHVLLHTPPVTARRYLPEGTILSARCEDGRTTRFHTESDLPLTSARVTGTAGITYETDPQVSLYTTLGAITGIRAGFDNEGMPLGRGVFVARNDAPVDMGLDIASDMFRLREGRRQIELRLNMRRATPLAAISAPCVTPPGPEPDPNIRLELQSDPELVHTCGFASLEEGIDRIVEDVQGLVHARGCTPSMSLIYEAMVRKTLKVEPLRLLLGRIFTLGLVEGQPWPTGEYWAVLKQRIDASQAALSGQRLTAPNTSDIFWHRSAEGNSILGEAFALNDDGTFVFSPGDVFQKFLSDAFTVTLSTADGPVRPNVLQVLPNGPDAPAGFTLRMTLEPDVAPIVPPAEAPDTAPVLSMRYTAGARICPASFFERYEIENIATRVNAADLKTLAAFSDDGPVAPDQSFLPFTSRPVDGSTLVIAAPEMASKPVSRVTLDVTWADLPDTSDGFDEHYMHYPPRTEIPSPEVTIDYLSGGTWKRLRDTATPLADRDPATRVFVSKWQRINQFDSPAIPEDTRSAAELPKTRGDVRGGALRLTLTGTANGFGQHLYPQALAQAMRPSLIPALKRPLPKTPFLPKIARLSLGYEAQGTIELSAPDSARPRDRIYQVTPFARAMLYPERTGRRATLFPARLGQASLFIKISGPDANKRLSLLFDIADGGHSRTIRERVPLVWHYLTRDGWTALPQTELSSDTTDGLLRSGTVSVDLPDDASSNTAIMPGGGLWLAVSAAHRGFDTHPVLSRVMTNGIWVSAVEPSEPDQGSTRVWSFDPGIPGAGKPIEVARRTPPRPSEDTPAFRARVSERLRHRKRAVTPWDIERLVLEAFPEVWRVKCLPHLTHDTAQPCHGIATIVVVRRPPKFDETASGVPQELLFDIGKLDRICSYIKRHAPPFARYRVVNPAFDRLFVRAKIRFADYSDDGALAFRLKTYLSRQLSVWTAPEDVSRFGWSLNVSQLRARISALSYIENVTDFSVLHFTSDDAGAYRLGDTAQSDSRGPYGTVIRPSRPWALALSAQHHALSATDHKGNIAPTQSGIGRLKVGDMLVVGQEAKL